MKFWVRVTPGAKTDELRKEGTEWIAKVAAPRMEGRANLRLIALLARQFDVPKSRITIRLGSSGRRKLIQIEP